MAVTRSRNAFGSVMRSFEDLDGLLGFQAWNSAMLASHFSCHELTR